jgi:hypothetical protein
MSGEHTSTLSDFSTNLPQGDDYRQLANGIRELAHRTRLPVARRELARLAASYDRRAELIDGRNIYW